MFENAEIGIRCFRCGHKTKKTIGWIKANDELTCDGCGLVRRFDSEKLVRRVTEVNEGLDDMNWTPSEGPRVFGFKV